MAFASLLSFFVDPIGVEEFLKLKVIEIIDLVFEFDVQTKGEHCAKKSTETFFLHISLWIVKSKNLSLSLLLTIHGF